MDSGIVDGDDLSGPPLNATWTMATIETVVMQVRSMDVFKPNLNWGEGEFFKFGLLALDPLTMFCS